MSDTPDSLAQLIDSPLLPLRPERTVPQRVEQLRAARELGGPDPYWEWVAGRQRWSTPWQTVRSGEVDDFRYFEGGRINVAENCVDRWAEDPATADRAAVVWEGEPGDTRTLTYAELAVEVSRLAAGLRELGVRAGDVVGRAPTVRATVVVDRTGDATPLGEGEHAYAAVLESGRAGTPAVPLDPNAPSFLIFTSGTESVPKGVVHSVGGFLLGTWANAHWQVGYEDGDVYWVAADVGWLTFPIQAVVGGLACGMTIACFEGALDTPTPARFYEICERHRVTKVLAAPTAARMLRKFGDDLAAAHPLPGLKLITMQGEPLDADTFAWTTSTFGVPVVNAYGQTETGSTWAYPVYGVEPLKAGSVGTAVPGHAFAIVDDDGAPVPAGVKGNLVLTAPFPTLARTVWDDHERYRATYFARFPGRYATHDEAVLDHDGHLWVLGRADDVINVAAHRISTMEIEAVVTAHAAVVEAAVVGVPDDVKGTVPIAFVTLRSGAETGSVRAEIGQHVITEMGGYARLAAIHVTSAMPKTRTGKTMRRLLRDLVVHGKPTGDTSAMEDPAVLDVVAAAVRE